MKAFFVDGPEPGRIYEPWFGSANWQVGSLHDTIDGRNGSPAIKTIYVCREVKDGLAYFHEMKENCPCCGGTPFITTEFALSCHNKKCQKYNRSWSVK